ncbi:hypothetical protein OJAV_G00192160 [Oryzias javanicus]|uniref:Cerebellar degeneration related protein 2 n=1 Tax=Oryzias javanicus TaxID=123683 RepID=A0A3S2MHZ8_ORYJA|nr:hypothetical protein OJAV_G00192160 [Oryzias javanicus]
MNREGRLAPAHAVSPADLQLAAELGKTLLERNRELEQGLQQMYTTNQEQVQEIEYLTKQVDLLRQVNDQHAKVYEQLDVSARELEQSNHKLALDNKKAQKKIQGLTETVDQLQTQVEELQHKVEELKLSACQSQKPPQRRRSSARSAQSVSCLQELQTTFGSDCDAEVDPDSSTVTSWHEEEQASLRQSLRALQVQFATERARREEAEHGADLLAQENAELEQQLSHLEGSQARVSELEREAEELRQLWKLESSSRSLRPDCIQGLLLHPEEESEGEPAAKSPSVLKRWASERQMKATQAPDSPNRIYDHECSCVRRAEVVKYRGISLLSEVDAQYSALQMKYNELLNRCHPGVEREEQLADLDTARPTWSHWEDLNDDLDQPEYKKLFREIFSCIKKTKEDLKENRERPASPASRKAS